MFSFVLTALTIGIMVALVARLGRRRTPSKALRLGEVGLIIDRSLRRFQRLLVPLLALSLLALPLGIGGGVSSVILTQLLGLRLSLGVPRGAPNALLGLGVLGVGKTLLGCGVGWALQLHGRGDAVTLGTVLRAVHWRRAASLAVLVALPSALAAALGLLGPLVALFWQMAPCALVAEELRPLAALRRSIKLVREHSSALFQTLAALWVIGWLLAGTPLLAGRVLLAATGALAPQALDRVSSALFALGTVAVAPLLAVGAFECFAYVAARDADAEPPLERRIDAWHVAAADSARDVGDM